MTILFDATVFVNSAPNFGIGIIPVETPAERHKRETFQIIDAVSEGRAFQFPVAIGSKNYVSFVAMMNAPIRPVAPARKPRFEPTWEDNQAAVEMFAAEEKARWEAAMDRAEQEARWYDEMAAIG